MLDSEFFTSLDPTTRDKWTSRLHTAYSEGHRYYHTLSHIESMLHYLLEARAEIELSSLELNVLHLAVLFHDVVYMIPSEPGYNEVYSALVFQEYAKEADLVY